MNVSPLFALGFLIQGLTTIILIWFGRRAESNKKAFRFQKQSVFSKKTVLEQGWLHHQRTRPVNRKERQCVDEKFELQMPKFVFRTTNASKTLGTLCSNFIDTFKCVVTTPVTYTCTKKRTDLFNILLDLGTNISAKGKTIWNGLLSTFVGRILCKKYCTEYKVPS